MIKQNDIKVLLMAKVHGGNLHHIYADTEILSARSLIILNRIPGHCSHACTSALVMGRTLDLPSVIELIPCKYKRVYFYFGVQKKLIFIYLFFFLAS
jgi:hypothetical protein